MLKRFVDYIWYRNKLLAIVLLPLSGLFLLLATIKKRKDSLQAQAFAVPIIVVGNIHVGGTGKTPVVIAIVQYLQSLGLKPAVVSRGYAGSAVYPYQLHEKSQAAESGDEPLLIYLQCACPVVVAPKRVEAIDYLLEHNAVDVIISDDGLQHYAMHRDIEIAVIDAARGIANSFCLPAGPLREPMSRLNSVDFIVQNGSAETSVWKQKLQAIKTPSYSMILEAEPLSPLGKTAMPAPKFGARLHALAAIGNPERFFKTLEQQGFILQRHAFADHHAFTLSDLIFADGEAVVMTAKDAVKCQDFLELDSHWQLGVNGVFSPDFLCALVQQLKPLLPATTAAMLREKI